ncbi:hypothetical protein H4V97_000271 [Flavobacterium sp. CG_23.5]|uniref:hypothetical protein n=1 Tax=Flavobacterium sp. CG_23.5 TaxID=2760708 RepID=UPI001AE875FE|nr:hypothetical protein [Flavobacterium sp. CG_23.5]MBP2281953.1 hypothetical protein [Flavobacterium sp. CG_23.5]
MQQKKSQATNPKTVRHVKSEAIKALEQLAFENLKNKFPSFPFHPKPKYNDNTTNQLTKAVIAYIQLKGGQAERVNSTGFMKDNRKNSTDILGRTRSIGSTKWIPGTGKTGTSDIHSVINGKSVKIEIKCAATADNKQSEGQIAYQKAIKAAGGIYLIVRTFQDFYLWLNEFCTENCKNS